MNIPEVYGIGAVALAVIAILFWVVKFMFRQGMKILKELSISITANTNVTNENLIYLKNKNGSMEKCFVDVTAKLEKMTDNQRIITDKLRELACGSIKKPSRPTNWQ